MNSKPRHREERSDVAISGCLELMTSASAKMQFSPEGMSADVSSHVLRTWPRRFAPRNDENFGSSKINNLCMGFMERYGHETLK
jgi:hypothetical protein